MCKRDTQKLKPNLHHCKALISNMPEYYEWFIYLDQPKVSMNICIFSADTICQTVLHVLVCGRSALFCSLSSTSSLYEQSENLVEKLGPYKFYLSFIMMFGIKWATTRQKITFLDFFFKFFKEGSLSKVEYFLFD